MSERYLYDAFGNVVRTVIQEDNAWGGSFKIVTSVDLAPLFDSNKVERELQEDEWFRFGKRDTAMGKKVAEVDAIVMDRALRERWDEDDWNKFLNDPDNRDYRIWGGRL